MKASELFENCLSASYIHLDGGADFAVKREGDTLFLFFEDSDGAQDWWRNFRFLPTAYRRDGKRVFWAHRGFLRAWESVLPFVDLALDESDIKRIVSVGYSHGAALALFCYEYAWYKREDLREHIEGYGFGAPRVVWGRVSRELKKRWESFTVVRNIDDLVTHLPPRFLGYRQVGKLLLIGKENKYSAIDAHRAENIMAELVYRERLLSK